jgi:hypothetical protein
MSLSSYITKLAKIKSQLPPGSLIPPVIVPFDALSPSFSNRGSQKLAEFSLAIANHNKEFLSLGLTYLQNVISVEAEQKLMDHTIDYMSAFGARVEDEHLIQLENVCLRLDQLAFEQMRDALHEKLGIPMQSIAMHPNFNYFPSAKTKLHAHHDNLFLADEICVLTVGYSGSARAISFKKWDGSHSFTLFVEPRSVYVMDGPVRYDYVHGGTTGVGQISDQVREIHEYIQSIRDQRLSYVLGVMPNSLAALNASPIQIWGESDQREIIDRAREDIQRALYKTPNLVVKPLNVLGYLELVEIFAKNSKDFDLLLGPIANVRKRYNDIIEGNFLSGKKVSNIQTIFKTYIFCSLTYKRVFCRSKRWRKRSHSPGRRSHSYSRSSRHRRICHL